MAKPEHIQLTGAQMGLEGDNAGITAKIFYHPPDEGLPLGGDLSSRVGPVMLDIYAADNTNQSEQDARAKAQVEAIKKLYTLIPGDQLLPLAKRLLKHTAITKGDQVFNLGDAAGFAQFFAYGNYEPLIPLMREVIKFNGFLGLDIASLVMGKPESEKSRSPETSA